MPDRDQKRVVIIALLGVVLASAFVLSHRVDIGDARKAENFARYGWLAGSWHNLVASVEAPKD